MKKLKMLMPILGLTTLTGMVVPITSCSPEYDRTVTLYTDIGTFSNGEKFINIHAYGAKKLNDIANYETPLLPTYSFAKWTDVNDKDFAEDTYVNGDLVLKANFEEKTGNPEDFTTDGWQTVIDVCEQEGFIPFAKTYCGYTGADEPGAKAAINEWILSDKNIRYVGLAYDDYPVLAKVRLIGIEQDKNSASSTLKFTFEFADVVDTLPFNEYSSEYLGTPFNRWADPTTLYSFVFYYLNLPEEGCFMSYMPDSLVDGMQFVVKQTVQTIADGSLDETTPVGNPTQTLFLLSRAELNDTNNQSGVSADAEFDYNSPYTFYNRGERTVDFDQLECRIKNYAGTDDPANYWTRSPYLGDYDPNQGIESKEDWEEAGNGWFANAAVVKDGGIFSSYSSFIGVGIAPAFCIGVEGE